MSVEIAGPITLRSPRSSKATSSMNPQRAATVRALHSPIRTRLRRHKIDGKQICKRIQPAFDVSRIGCLAPARMSPVRSRCCRRAFFTQHVTVRTLHCRPPSAAVRSGGTRVVVEPGRMPVTDCDQAALCTALESSDARAFAPSQFTPVQPICRLNSDEFPSMRDGNSLLKTSLKLHRTECHGSGRGITADLFSLKLRYAFTNREVML